ncbi:MAG: ASCH domain-containing protein [Blastocatellia bacterium]
MRALSVRQPYAEQIMRGVKKIEFRSFPTNIRERIYIYASLTPGELQDWKAMKLSPGDLPTGVLIGTVEIVDCTEKSDGYKWH